MKVRGIRGAVRIAEDAEEVVLEATAGLLTQIFERNELTPDDVVSIFFTATPDVSSTFPASAARRLGMAHVALLCAQELAVEGAMTRVVRVLVHAHTDRRPQEIAHVYIGETRSLREDLA